MNAAAVNNDFRWMEGRNGKKVGDTILIPCPCKYLDDWGKCKLHEIGKPKFCREFPEIYGAQKFLKDLGCRYFDE